MDKISISELAQILADKSGLKKKIAEQFAIEMFDVIKSGIEQDQLAKVKGLGTFKVIDVEPRASVDVNTGERVVINGHRKISFVPDAAMKELVNKPFSQFETVVLNDGVSFDDMVEEKDQPNDTEEEVSLQDMPEEPADEVEEPVVEVEEPVVEVEEPVVEAEEPVVENEEPIAETEESAAETEEVPVQEDIQEEQSAHTAPLIEFYDSQTNEMDSQSENQEETDEAEEETEDVEEDEEDLERPRYGWKIAVVALMACAIGFAAGYFVGQRATVGQKAEVADTLIVSPKKEVRPAPAEKLAKPVEQADSVKPAKPAVIAEETKQPEPVKQPEQSAKPAEPAKPAVNEAVNADKYEQMDARVRTGAYRIVGTDHTLKVRAGDDLKKIAKRTLGPDMECYIEVYNGITAATPLEAGKELKIPKIELKKKRKKTEE
ncbi:MAG: HU family DNA-binding protein [Prevotella sp.]|nr:HU family DNA-binding protein [Prevotella sp.]